MTCTCTAVAEASRSWLGLGLGSGLGLGLGGGRGLASRASMEEAAAPVVPRTPSTKHAISVAAPVLKRSSCGGRGDWNSLLHTPDQGQG